MSRQCFVKLIREIAAEEDIRITGFSGDWSFRMEKEGVVRFTVGYHFPLNRSSAKELCQDKCLTYDVLTAASIPAVPHLFFPNPASGDVKAREAARLEAMHWLSEGGEVVVKNNYGTGGREVYRVRTEAEFEEKTAGIFEKSYAAALSPFLRIREEYRAVMLDGQALLLIRKERESRTNERGEKEYLNWKHNLGQGATGIVVTDPEILRSVTALSERTVKALDVRFASVDVVDTAEGFFVLEVNAGVMLEHFAGQDETCYALAKEVYRAAIRAAFLEGSKS